MKSIIKKAVKNAKKDIVKKKRVVVDDDDDLINILEKCSARIKVIGAGGSGNNTLNRMVEIGIVGAKTLAVNTDAQHLVHTKADARLLLGPEITKGLGAGSNPEIGEAAARENLEELTEQLKGNDLVFITCGMGGGTGTGSAPVVAEIAKDLGLLTVAVVTLPFSVEGNRRRDNALEGLSKLKKYADTIIIIPNDKLLEVAPDLPITAAFKVADEVLVNAVKGITEMITKPGLVNLDFSDLKTILNHGGPAMIGLGESEGQETGEARALEAVENALSSPLLDVDISDASRALINVTGGNSMTLREAEMIVEAVSSRIHPNAHIIWGAMIDEEVTKNTIQAMVVVSGARFPYLEEGKGGQKVTDAKEGVDLELDYVD